MRIHRFFNLEEPSKTDEKSFMCWLCPRQIKEMERAGLQYWMDFAGFVFCANKSLPSMKAVDGGANLAAGYAVCPLCNRASVWRNLQEAGRLWIQKACHASLRLKSGGFLHIDLFCGNMPDQRIRGIRWRQGNLGL